MSTNVTNGKLGKRGLIGSEGKPAVSRCVIQTTITVLVYSHNAPGYVKMQVNLWKDMQPLLYIHVTN